MLHVHHVPITFLYWPWTFWKLMLNLSTLLMTPSCHDVSLPCPLGIWGAHRQDCSNYLEAYRTEADIDCHSKGWISDIVLLDVFPIFPLVIFLTCHQCSRHHLGMKGMTCFILWAVLLQSLRKGPRSSDQKTFAWRIHLPLEETLELAK